MFQEHSQAVTIRSSTFKLQWLALFVIHSAIKLARVE